MYGEDERLYHNLKAEIAVEINSQAVPACRFGGPKSSIDSGGEVDSQYSG